MTKRRDFLLRIGASAAVLPFLPHLEAAESVVKPKQRLVFVFTPNGTVPEAFWPAGGTEDFKMGAILQPLAAYRERLLVIKGLANKVRGDGDGHMRGMSCLLTGIELFPGNIQGGGETPAGWSKGISIDQEIRNFLQSQNDTKTRFGSLELGVAVPNRADPWTRWAYAGPNQPVSPLSEPSEVFARLYGQMNDRESLGSVLDEVIGDLYKVQGGVSTQDKEMLDKHLTLVREMEVRLKEASQDKLAFPPPVLDPGLGSENDDIPQIFAAQSELAYHALANDMARVVSLQFTNSVGQSRFRWLGIEEPHHSLSHDPDHNAVSVEKLTKINVWLAEQVAHLAKRLAETPEPAGAGSMLDHTTIVWTNELGKGNSHSHEDIPFVLLGGGLGFRGGRFHDCKSQPHNRLWLSIAQAMGHPLKTFGNRELCGNGPLVLS